MCGRKGEAIGSDRKAAVMYYLDFWYVFFVKTGKEQDALEETARYFPREEIKPFRPYVEHLFRKNRNAPQSLFRSRNT